jgi:exodeoxyribonuclease VII small subunit
MKIYCSPTVVDNQSFEESLKELEDIVQKLEVGDVSLDESMALFERGLTLSTQSSDKLKSADQKVKILIEKHGKNELDDFGDAVNLTNTEVNSGKKTLQF